jgi:uncharacterized protein HemX
VANWNALAGVAALIGLAITIGGIIFALGKRDARLDSLEKKQAEDKEALEERMKEDREKNSAQHGEFYATGRAVIEIAADLKNVGRQVDGMQTDIRELLNRIPAKG